MPRTRGPYPPEFKARMVELVRAGRSPGSLAKEFEPSANTIRNWAQQADPDEGRRSDGLTTQEREELRRLRRELKQVKLEREILAKAEASPIEEQQRKSTEADAEAGRRYKGLGRVKRGRKTEWRVVLAEDDEEFALLVEQALEKAADIPVEIRRARTGYEALALLREILPDLLLLDLKMPGMGGHEALEQIKGNGTLLSVPVAVLTSSRRVKDVAKSYGLGANHFIKKPSDPAELEAKLGALLRNLKELQGIRRGAGTSTTAVTAVGPHSMAVQKALRWAVVVGVLLALYFFGRVSGAF